MSWADDVRAAQAAALASALPGVQDELAAVRADREAAATIEATPARVADKVAGQNLLAAITTDIGFPIADDHALDAWPGVKNWTTLKAVQKADVTTVPAVMTIIVWMVPACFRLARAVRKLLRLQLAVTTADSS